MKNDASGDATAVAGTNLADSGDVGSSRGGVAREETVVQVAAVVTSEGDPNDQQRHTQPTKAVVMGKHNGEDYDESAQERMLKEDSAPKISPVKDSTEVKFISENGDAKIDIETVKDTRSGMTKEELMKYANDPFWIKLRWSLFIGFWLLWVAMLVGAIAIVVMAPKCSPPEPKKLWEESPIVRLEVSSSPANNLKGLESVLNDLQELHIKAISLSSLVKESPNGETEDFKDIKPELGVISDLEALIKAAKEKGQQIFLELDPNHSSVNHPWFKRSVNREEPFTSYYVWADGIINIDNGKVRRSPPNNWLSIYGESAWEWHDHRGQYYLHQFNKTQPDLNYNNSAVVKEFGEILTHWLKLGISGFRLANTRYLTEAPNLHNESRSHFPVEANDYHSLIHVHTRDRTENAAVLMTWREIVYNETDGKGLFALQDDIAPNILQVFNEKKVLIDLPQNSHFLTTANENINATVLHNSITRWLDIAPWPAWDLNGKLRPMRQRVPNDVADSIMLMTMLLPGTPILELDDLVSAKNEFATLSNARSGLTFLHGDTMTKIVNGTVFVYMRLKSGNPGYIVAYHTGDTQTVIDLSEIPRVPKEINVYAHSPNYVQDTEDVRDVKTKLPSNSVPISSKSTLILTFVPNE